ncbi:MAG: 50S ribosomal protein L10 [Halobacteriales archaeon]|nr:50S ribosomal protein L10 [Halobacteriales archaeon]
MSADVETERQTETIPEWKREEVAALADLIREHESVGVVDITGIPSRQLQEMRRDLHGTAAIRMGRNTLIQLALEEVDEGVESLAEYVDGHVGLIGTDDNPFALFRELEASKTPAPIGAGEVAPNDIVIPEGDTGMDPGPFVGELQNVGAQAQIMEGSIKVTADSTVAEAGDVVSDDLANVLSELGIEPKEVGLDLRAVYSEGVLFEADELELDIDEFRADFEAASSAGRNLSINAGYPTAGTIGGMLAKASGEAKAVGLQAEIESPDILGDLVSRADGQVRSLAAAIDDKEALPEELQDVKEAPVEPADEDADSDDEQPTEDEPETTDSDTETDAETDADADDDDDEDAAAEGLGDMFG